MVAILLAKELESALVSRAPKVTTPSHLTFYWIAVSGTNGWWRRMSFLLVPEDESELTVYLCEELGAKLLLSDIAMEAEPQIARDPLQALPAQLPHEATPGCKEIYELLFWLPACGPIKTMRDAPEATDARDRVAQLLTRDSAANQFADVIDTQRTPVLRLRRSTKMAGNRLAPGLLGTMRIQASALPQDVRRMHAKATRWLKKRGAKTDPFLHCPEVKERRPANLRPLWVWVQPYAMELVEQGTEIWPWNA